MSTFLALKYAAPEGFFKRLFHRLTAARLLTRYPHSGIVQDGVLMHSNLARGLHIEPFKPAGWLLIPIEPALDPVAAVQRLDGMPYDWFSLLAFVLPWRVRDRSRMYCYEWCWYIQTGRISVERVTPEDLAIEALKNTHHDSTHPRIHCRRAYQAERRRIQLPGHYL